MSLSESIYFLHIPKTSGTSLYGAIDTLFQPEEIFPKLTWWQVANAPLAERAQLLQNMYTRKYKFMRGHFGANHHLMQGRKVIAMFRNPVYRTISQLRHIHRDPVVNAWVDERFTFDGDDLFSPLRKPELAQYVANLQTKHLLTDYDPTPAIADLPEGGMYFWEQHPAMLASVKGPEPLVFTKVLNKLRQLDWFGIQEFHPESIILFNEKFGVELPKLEGRRMAFGEPSETIELSGEQKALLKSINRSDRVLYTAAKRTFMRRWQNYLRRKHQLDMTFDTYQHLRAQVLERIGYSL